MCNTNVSFTNSNGFSRVFLWIQKSTPPNTWLRLRDYKAGALVEEYRTDGPYLAHVGYSIDIHWIRLTPFGEQFYRENWQQYRDLYPAVDAPAPGGEL